MTTTTAMSDPVAIMARLAEIEEDLAHRQNELQDAAMAWFRAKRDREKELAVVFMRSEGTVAERHALAELAAGDVAAAEGTYEALKAVVRVLETRASIGQTLLRTHGRA